MPKFLPPDSSDFPEPALSDSDGLLAFGSNLRVDTLLKAYQKGIFPWFNEKEIIYWYSPDPRFILYPHSLRISHSMRNVLNKHLFRFTVDRAFSQVINNCRLAIRKGEPGSWISADFENAYNDLFLKGFAHSAEVWENNQLVGGLYGVLIGKVFFGESMFSNKNNASKFALIKWVEILKENGIELIDCQVYTPHLESLGAELITRKNFTELLKKLITE